MKGGVWLSLTTFYFKFKKVLLFELQDNMPESLNAGDANCRLVAGRHDSNPQT
jgi:hypothetical protein